MAKKKKRRKKKKKNARAGGKQGSKKKTKRGRRRGREKATSSPVLSIDDMPGLPQIERKEFKLYRRWEGLPRDDSFFQRWLVTTPPDDPSFSRLGGDRAIRLLLSDSAPIIENSKNTTKSAAPRNSSSTN